MSKVRMLFTSIMSIFKKKYLTKFLMNYFAMSFFDLWGNRPFHKFKSSLSIIDSVACQELVQTATSLDYIHETLWISDQH